MSVISVLVFLSLWVELQQHEAEYSTPSGVDIKYLVYIGLSGRMVHKLQLRKDLKWNCHDLNGILFWHVSGGTVGNHDKISVKVVCALVKIQTNHPSIMS
jgi:hypothetical protein